MSHVGPTPVCCGGGFPALSGVEEWPMWSGNKVRGMEAVSVKLWWSEKWCWDRSWEDGWLRKSMGGLVSRGYYSHRSQ